MNNNYLSDSIVNFPTRQNKILDLIFVNNINIVSCVQPVAIDLAGTDHEAIQFTCKCCIPKANELLTSLVQL